MIMVNTRDYTSALIDITDDGPGKENWFQLGDYMKALKFEARDRNVPYHQVLEERASQISRNLRTVFGRWIEQHNREFEELMKGNSFALIGSVNNSKKLLIKAGEKILVNSDVLELKKTWKKTLQW